MPDKWLEKLNEPKGKLGRGKVGWNSFSSFFSLDSLARATNLSNR